MKHTYTNKLSVVLLAASLSFLTLPVFASKEDIQSRASVQIYKLQQQIKAAEANKQQTETVKAVECKKLVEQGKKC